MKILTTVGARPNFMKVAPILAEINRHNARISTSAAGRRARPAETIQHVLVHTGQHYGDLMSGSFFRDLGLPAPDVHLGVGSGSHAVQTAEIMKKFEAVLLSVRPDMVMVVGDVNSTLACALVAAKISFDPAGTRPLIVHVEAGLRSFDGSMPEEINRILTDHVSDVLFVTEDTGLQNLRHEGIPSERIHFVGNTMIDSLLAFQERAEASTILEALGLRRRTTRNGPAKSTDPYTLLTLHRPSNVDNRDAFLSILAGLDELARDGLIVFPVHPRTRRRIQEFDLELSLGGPGTEIEGPGSDSESRRHGMVLTDPLGYLDFLCLLKHATLVVTDSGGIQEETTCLGIPCVTVRENTERPVTVESGTNIVAGTDRERIKDAIRRQRGKKASGRVPTHWDGRAAARIVDVLLHAYSQRASRSGPEGARPAAVAHPRTHGSTALV